MNETPKGADRSKGPEDVRHNKKNGDEKSGPSRRDVLKSGALAAAAAHPQAAGGAIRESIHAAAQAGGESIISSPSFIKLLKIINENMEDDVRLESDYGPDNIINAFVGEDADGNRYIKSVKERFLETEYVAYDNMLAVIGMRDDLADVPIEAMFGEKGFYALDEFFGFAHEFKYDPEDHKYFVQFISSLNLPDGATLGDLYSVWIEPQVVEFVANEIRALKKNKSQFVDWQFNEDYGNTSWINEHMGQLRDLLPESSSEESEALRQSLEEQVNRFKSYESKFSASQKKSEKGWLEEREEKMRQKHENKKSIYCTVKETALPTRYIGTEKWRAFELSFMELYPEEVGFGRQEIPDELSLNRVNIHKLLLNLWPDSTDTPKSIQIIEPLHDGAIIATTDGQFAEYLESSEYVAIPKTAAQKSLG